MKIKPSSSLSSPVGQTSVVNQVIERIKEAIVAKELVPGDYLPTETELIDNLGVSKTSVREAIKMLQALGVLEVKRGRGTRIREKFNGDVLSPLIYQLLLAGGSIREIIDFRIMFEPAYTIMAMERATPDDLSRIAATIEKLTTAVAENRQTVQEDMAFHLAILHSTHNPLVIRVGETIIELFKASIGYTVKHYPDFVLRDHRTIYAALCKKDKDMLREAIEASFEGWKKGLEMTQ